MKKQYIEPSTAVYTFSVAHIVAESYTSISEDSASQRTDTERDENGGGDGDARNVVGNHSIWDNAW